MLNLMLAITYMETTLFYVTLFIYKLDANQRQVLTLGTQTTNHTTVNE